MKAPTTIGWITLLALVGVCVVYPVWSNQAPLPAQFKPITPQDFMGLIGWLVAVALFVERAVEVVVMVFRDQQADLLEEAETRATQDFDTANKKAAALAADNAAAPGDKKLAADAAEAASQKLAAAQHDTVLYRAQTKEIALLVSFGFGLFVSLAGVRALQGLLSNPTTTSQLFTAADIVVTGALIAGGSEGIHRIANAFTSFVDSLSARTDQLQKQAQDTPKTKA